MLKRLHDAGAEIARDVADADLRKAAALITALRERIPDA
jgi:hypothetical protein